MVASATNIVSVADMKTELRIDETEFDHDLLIAAHIAAAVSWAEGTTGVPWVDRPASVAAVPPRDPKDPVPLLPFTIAIASASFYLPGVDAINGEPSGVMSMSDFGRFDKSTSLLWPADGGWPAAVADSEYLFDITLGTDLLPTPPAIRAAVILVTRHLYDGYGAIKPGNAAFHLVAPYRSVTAA